MTTPDRSENTVEIIDRYRKDQIKMEMDSATHGLLQTILLEYFGDELMTTRASVGEKLVVVIKERKE